MSPLDRLPRTPLVTRLLAAITAVLAISFVVTYLVESNLTRSALRAQALGVLEQRASQAQSVLLDDVQEILVELQHVKSAYGRSTRGPGDEGDLRALRQILLDVAATRPFTVVGAYDRAGDAVVTAVGPELAPPPESVFRSPNAMVSARVVDTADGRKAYVTGELLGEAPDEVLVVFGYVFDRGLARTIRDATGGDDIVLEAGGEVTASSLPGAPHVDELQRVGEEEAACADRRGGGPDLLGQLPRRGAAPGRRLG